MPSVCKPEAVGIGIAIKAKVEQKRRGIFLYREKNEKNNSSLSKWVNIQSVYLGGTAAKRSKALAAVREVRGSNPAAAVISIFFGLFGPNVRKASRWKTHIDAISREASFTTHIDGIGRVVFGKGYRGKWR